MAAESLTPPPPTGGGFAKYMIVLLLLLAGGLGIYLAMGGEEEAPPPPPVKSASPRTTLSDDELEIPVEEEEEEKEEVDASTPPEPTKKKPRGRAQDPWACRGDLPPPEIRKVLAEYQSAIRSCYERQLRNNNTLQGAINLQVKIDGQGKVAATRVRGSMRDQEVLRCVQRLAKSWTFPPPTGGDCAVFNAPYNFTPKN